MPFLPENYMPWRNYSRVLKLSLIVSEENGVAMPTPVAHLLACAGSITCDEYMHFIIQTFTEPSPALRDWRPNSEFRFPLVFSLRYILTKLIVNGENSTSLNEIIGAYVGSGFKGSETDNQFIFLVKYGNEKFVSIGKNCGDKSRQARESLKVISQISYLHYAGDSIIVSLDPDDAKDIFNEMEPVQGVVSNDPDDEIFRLADLFKGGTSLEFFDYKNTILSSVLDSGFSEGNKVRKTHITIERNSRLKSAFFSNNPTTICDACRLDTKKKYPWTDKVLDLHHLLPLSSGTRVEAKGTMLNDLVPVCPTCHRAVHRYYDLWLIHNKKSDFENHQEAAIVYQDIKNILVGSSSCLI